MLGFRELLLDLCCKEDLRLSVQNEGAIHGARELNKTLAALLEASQQQTKEYCLEPTEILNGIVVSYQIRS